MMVAMPGRTWGDTEDVGIPPVPFQTVILETIMYPETREMLLN